MERALVVLSGGQDSTTCLYWALNHFDVVEALSFDYGQRHRVELASARKVARLAGVEHTLLPIDTFSVLAGNALTDPGTPVERGHGDAGLPNTFVPGRNLIFLTYAAAFAYPREIRCLVTGTAQTDYSGYPDCRRETLDALETTLSLGLESEFQLLTPLMFLSKGQTVSLAMELGAMQALAWTHTCYNGLQPPCGECAACQLRASGFQEAGVRDPLLERLGVE